MTRVVKIEKTGGPEVLEIKNIQIPEPGPDQVLIETKAIGLNYILILIIDLAHTLCLFLPELEWKLQA